MSARWHAATKAAHTRQMASCQAFPLFGDGASARGVIGQDERDAERLAGELADARYRDWLAQQRHGETAPRVAYQPPPLMLTGEPGAAVQTPLRLAPARPRATPASEAATILRALVEEFGELFPDEYRAAVAWLARHG